MLRTGRAPQLGAQRSIKQQRGPRHSTSVRASARPARTQFTELPNGAWVADAGQRPRGVVHFLGGAFAGAAPQALYNLFIDLLAQEGLTVITTPYHVTFRHTDMASNVAEAFQTAQQQLRAEGRGYLVPDDVPTFGVGHSNGALLHLFIGSLLEDVYDANVIVSFNNKQVSDAIPIPGLLEGLRPAVAASRELPFQAPVTLEGVARAITQQAAEWVPPSMLDARLVARATAAIEQLGTVVGEIGEGVSDFTPTPSESRRIIREGYRVPQTLLVRFTDDTIDETPEMAALLRAANPAGTQELLLPGTHVTPVGTDINWPVGQAFTPLDALALATKKTAQQDVRRLVGRISAWLQQQQQQARRPPAESPAEDLERVQEQLQPAPVPVPVSANIS